MNFCSLILNDACTVPTISAWFAGPACSDLFIWKTFNSPCKDPTSRLPSWASPTLSPYLISHLVNWQHQCEGHQIHCNHYALKEKGKTDEMKKVKENLSFLFATSLSHFTPITSLPIPKVRHDFRCFLCRFDYCIWLTFTQFQNAKKTEITSRNHSTIRSLIQHNLDTMLTWGMCPSSASKANNMAIRDWTRME